MRVTANIPKIKVNNNAKVVKGEDGFSPIVSLIKVGSVTTLSIQDKYGLHTVQILDGDSGEIPEETIARAIADYLAIHPIPTLTPEDVEAIVAEYVTEHKDELKGADGKDGRNGVDGYTPIKGVDYYTSSDIDGMIAEVFNRVTDGNEVAY